MEDALRTPWTLSLGMSDFAAMRGEGAIYVDKTDMVFALTRLSRSYFLSRPRRFGKSLLVSTFENYFLGRKELFRGLRIFDMEEACPNPWRSHPVLKFSFAGGNLEDGKEAVEAKLDTILETYERRYGVRHTRATARFYPERFARLIDAASDSSKGPIVVLVDEYDRPMEALRGDEMRRVRNLLKVFWGVLKDKQEKLRFVFFTGVTKHQKVSIFSELNNLVDLTADRRYTELCGLTRGEIESYYAPFVESLAESCGLTREECLAELSRRYDGYRFRWPSEGIFNPYSVLSALDKQEFGNYWFQSGTPGTLPQRIANEGLDLAPLMDGKATADADSLSELNPEAVALVPLLFQTGYLTIKGPADELGHYPLGFPNEEVRMAFTGQLANYVFPNADGGQSGLTIKELSGDLRSGDLASCMNRLKALLASLPYDRGNPRNSPIETNYQNALYIVFTLLGVTMRTEVTGARGVCDAIAEAASHVYVFEFKRDRPASEALAQIKRQGYAERFAASGKVLHLVGVSFSTALRTIDEWMEEQ